LESARKTTEKDLNPVAEQKLKDEIKRHLSMTGKKRFLSKQTANTQRIRLIDKMFNDAFYIHIIRDGRAAANSMSNVSWWNENEIWWLDGAKASEWERQGKPVIELCGKQWKQNVLEIQDNSYLFEARYLEIRYEDLIADVWGTMDSICSFCELKQSKSFLDVLPQTLPDMNKKWQKNLTAKQKEILERVIGPTLKELGYVD
jgi:hypothetical protein